MKLTSRRSVLVLAAGMPAIIKARGAQSSPKDIDLLQLGEQFDVLAAHLDHAIEHRLHVDWAHLEELSRVKPKSCKCPPSAWKVFIQKRGWRAGLRSVI